jgi:flagellar motor switch protein FliG
MSEVALRNDPAGKSKTNALTVASLSGAERAAIVLQELGEETAAAILREMDENAVTRVSTAMATMKLTPPGLRDEVINHFTTDMISHGLSNDSMKFLNRVLTTALGESQARDILRRLSKGDPNRTFRLPPNADPRTLAMQMERERPQTIALLLAYIPQDIAADMLAFLPEQLATEALYRFSILDVVSPNAVQELQNMVDELMSAAALGGRRVSNLGGAKQTADILNHLQADFMDSVLGNIDDRDNPTAERIRENLFTFTDLIKLPDRSLRLLLREVANELLAPALRLAEKDLKERFFTNISARQKEILNEELNGGPTMRRADVLAAQGEIVAIALRLSAEGKIAVNAAEEMI